MEFKFVSPERPSKCTWTPDGTLKNPHPTDYNKPSDRKNVLPNILHATGLTPMVKLNHIPKKYGIKCEMLAKCEFMNPGGSLKDRIVIQMVEDAEAKGLLKPGYTIIEPTSGNTGVGVAMVSAAKGYPCIIVMSEEYSDEKLYTMQALGAKVIRTPMEAAWNSDEGPMATAQKLQKQMPNSVILDQYTNLLNPLTHYNETATEIWEQCGGKVDYIVGGVGTGGILSGIGRKFRELSPSTKIVVSDPRKPPLAKCLHVEDRIHNVEGIGHNYTTVITDLNVIDIQVKTTEKECFLLARDLIKEEGLLCGGSSGASLAAALSFAKDLPADKRVVILLNDTIRNYMTKFVSDSWMETKGFLDPPKPVESNEWWWNLPASKLPLNKPVILPTDCTCDKAIQFFRENGIRETPMSDDKGGIKGFITLDKLLSSLISGEVKQSDLAVKTLVKQYKRAPKTTILGKLSRILQHSSPYIFIFDKDNDGAAVGIVTQNNLFDFISSKK